MALDGGKGNTFYITASDKVYAVGSQTTGQVGTGSTDTLNTYTELTGFSGQNIKSITGGATTMAVLGDANKAQSDWATSSLLATGLNGHGELGRDMLGNGSATDYKTFVNSYESVMAGQTAKRGDDESNEDYIKKQHEPIENVVHADTGMGLKLDGSDGDVRGLSAAIITRRLGLYMGQQRLWTDGQPHHRPGSAGYLQQQAHAQLRGRLPPHRGECA